MVDSILNAVESVEWQGFKVFGVVPGVEIRERTHSTMLNSGMNVDLFNGVFKIRLEEHEAEKIVNNYIREFSKKKTPFLVHTSELTKPTTLGTLLEQMGFIPTSEGVMYTVDFQALPDSEWDPLPAGLKCQRVSQEKELEEFIKVFSRGFNLPSTAEKAFKKFYKYYGIGADKNYQNLILRNNGRAVAVASVLGNRNSHGSIGNEIEIPDDICTIMRLAVLPDARGRGYGTAISRAARQFARECGYSKMYTTATPEGIAVYRKRPLNEVGKYKRWLWKQ